MEKRNKILQFITIISILALIGYYFGETKIPVPSITDSASSIEGARKNKKVSSEFNPNAEEVQSLVQSSNFQNLVKDEKFLALMNSPEFIERAKTTDQSEWSKDSRVQSFEQNEDFTALMKNQTFTGFVHAGKFSELQKLASGQ